MAALQIAKCTRLPLEVVELICEWHMETVYYAYRCEGSYCNYYYRPLAVTTTLDAAVDHCLHHSAKSCFIREVEVGGSMLDKHGSDYYYKLRGDTVVRFQRDVACPSRYLVGNSLEGFETHDALVISWYGQKKVYPDRRFRYPYSITELHKEHAKVCKRSDDDGLCQTLEMKLNRTLAPATATASTTRSDEKHPEGEASGSETGEDDEDVDDDVVADVVDDVVDDDHVIDDDKEQPLVAPRDD